MSDTNGNLKGLVLSVHPTPRGFGWVLFESPLAPVDWGIASAKLGRQTRITNRFERLLDRYEPAELLLEEFDRGAKKRTGRIVLLCRAMVNLAQVRGISVEFYDRETIAACFAQIGAKTRYEIAQAVAQRIEVFRRRLPRKRTIATDWDVRQSLFDAAALAITHFAVMGEGVSR